MNLEFHPLTVQDVRQATTYYRAIRPELAHAFQHELDTTLDRIARDPARNPVVEGHIRRCLVHRFPYSVLYRIIDDQIVRILVIRHHKRRSGFGLTRT